MNRYNQNPGLIPPPVLVPNNAGFDSRDFPPGKAIYERVRNYLSPLSTILMRLMISLRLMFQWSKDIEIALKGLNLLVAQRIHS